MKSPFLLPPIYPDHLIESSKIYIGAVIAHPSGNHEVHLTPEQIILAGVAKLTPEQKLSLIGGQLDAASGELRIDLGGSVKRFLPLDA